MNFYSQDLRISTRKRIEILDITEEVYRIVMKSGIKNGLVNLWVPHSTAAIAVNEHDTDLWGDIVNVLQKIAPLKGDYQHNAKYGWSMGEQNAHAHILSCLIKPGVSIPLENGRMHLGTWQSILFIEMDGSRSRRVHVQIIGE
ncbi:TPA: YjbQ family protein [Candidatus Bathyarchaeota archaeon]|nr:YjbQ family protein [Candidatus Bathyarchaeota archaeon]